jgi:hypothetical protein
MIRCWNVTAPVKWLGAFNGFTILPLPIPDFAAWKEDPNLFEIEFARLIRALRKESNRELTQ